MLFSELPLKESSLKAIEALGFEAPSDIQEKSIPLLVEKDIDFIGQAQTGTGKTAAFALPLFEKIDFSNRDIQALILAPTRELANQICEEIKKLSKFEPVRTLAVYGGQPVSTQLKSLRSDKPQIIVGTPGRVLDFVKRGALKMENVKHVILDEADEMLDMGFFDDVNEILDAAGDKDLRKIWMFSATMPKPILKLINKHFCDPELVKVTKKILTSESIKQQYCLVRRSNQAEALCRFLDFTQEVYAIVFTRTKVGAKQLMDDLNLRGFPSDALHGDMSQEQRDLTMKKFKQKKINLLVCTDVAARGIDVSDLTHVINYGLPQDNESYVHRIGRTGRGGNQGIALSLIEPSESRRLRDIERITQAKIEKVELPTVEAIKGVLAKKAYGEFKEDIGLIDSETNEDFKSFKEQFADLSTEDLLKGAFSFIYKASLKRYQNARALDEKARDRKDSSRERGERNSSGGKQAGYQRFFVALGRKDGINPGSMIRMVASGANISGSDIGRIDIKDAFSFFEVPDQYQDVIMNLNNTEWDRKKVSIEVASARPGGDGPIARSPRRGGGRRSSSPRRGASSGPRRSGSANGNSDFKAAGGSPKREFKKRRSVQA